MGDHRRPCHPGTRITRLSGTDDTEAMMRFLFDDESFSFEVLRATGFAAYGGADLGEVLVTAAAITSGDEASWQRVREIGEQALAPGHRVSAREAMLRASNYYRAAEFYLREKPAADPEVTAL